MVNSLFWVLDACNIWKLLSYKQLYYLKICIDYKYNNVCKLYCIFNKNICLNFLVNKKNCINFAKIKDIKQYRQNR